MKIKTILKKYNPSIIFNLAAETHVDNSIESPGIFVETNIIGTYNLLRAVLEYQNNFKNNLRFLHVSTDEVFGDLEIDDPKFNEQTRYEPSSPYSASKASSDHFIRAYGETYGMPYVITNCSNNYGPNQFPEKLIPLFINNSISLTESTNA